MREICKLRQANRLIGPVDEFVPAAQGVGQARGYLRRFAANYFESSLRRFSSSSSLESQFIALANVSSSDSSMNTECSRPG